MLRRGLASFARCNVRKASSIQSRFLSLNQSAEREGCVFVDSIFPVTLGKFDFRQYLVNSQQGTLLTSLKERLNSVKTHDMEITSVEPYLRDGGVFVQFKYKTDDSADEIALKNIEKSLKKQVQEKGGIATWLGTQKPNVWLVKGSPWREDIAGHFASAILKVSFEGPDVPEETIYQLFRPYGHISELTLPTPVPAGTRRFTMIHFYRIKSATAARNVLYGLQVPTPNGTTHLRISYFQAVEVHVVQDYIAKYPRFFAPVIVFLIGTLTYAIFDPIRVFMVEVKVSDWFDIKELRIYKWLRANTLDRISKSKASPDKQVWKEREDAEMALQTYLSDLPSTVAFVYGPQGSGKSTMIASALQTADRKTLTIDCHDLSKASSDAQLVAGLAKQTGYWPTSSILNNANNFIDLASVGLVGQKAGLSRSVDEQLQQILDTVAVGLRNVGEKRRRKIQKMIQAGGQQKAAPNATKDVDKSASEKGEGQNPVDEHKTEGKSKVKDSLNVQAVEALPIVVIRNFAGKTDPNREDLLNGLAQWAAKLAENQIAHVIVVSDNRENAKRVAKALQAKPLNFVGLNDVDPHSARAFVQEKLHEANVNVSLSQEDEQYVQRLGGRSVDLESLVNKVRAGMSIKEAVEDMISRAVSELRKNAFGDDPEDAKNFPWTRDQAWMLLNLLSIRSEVPYHQVLLEHPFKGEEASLRSMEHAELITIATQDGRPSVIRPGRPVYRWVYERLVNDPIFRATQEIEFNTRLISDSETTIRSCEDELLRLTEIRKLSSWLGEDPSMKRAQYLMKKMMDAERKLETLEKENAELKETLSKLS